MPVKKNKIKYEFNAIIKRDNDKVTVQFPDVMDKELMEMMTKAIIDSIAQYDLKLKEQ